MVKVLLVLYDGGQHAKDVRFPIYRLSQPLHSTYHLPSFSRIAAAPNSSSSCADQPIRGVELDKCLLCLEGYGSANCILFA
jgi:hypothetical protein